MKLITMPLVLLVFLAGTAHAGGILGMFDDWDTTDIVLGSAYTYLHLELDRRQTITIGQSDIYFENDPIGKRVIGKHPSKGQVNNYFVGTWLFSMIIADALKGEARKFFLTCVTFESYKDVHNNQHLGVTLSTRF